MAIPATFDHQEAKELLGLSAYIEDGVQPPIPDPRPQWALLFDSPQIGNFENKWQLWRRAADGRFAIAVRGTIPQAGSVLEDLISIIVRAEGSLSVGALQCPYKFAVDPEAGVHLGFAVGALLLLTDPTNGILVQLSKCGVTAGSDVYITGHSQGAAVATLIRSYFEYSGGMPANCSIKTYVFAQPKPGNQHYADDFEDRFCNSEMAYRVSNVLDWVPEVPFTLQSPYDIDQPNPISVIASPPVIAALITKAVAEIQALIELHSRSRLQAKVVTLVHTTSPQRALAPAPETLLPIPFSAPIMPTLDFVNAGTDFPLLGQPCVGVQCRDAFWEHHCTTYYPLL